MRPRPSSAALPVRIAAAGLVLAGLACSLLPPASAVLRVTPVDDPGVLMAPLLMAEAGDVLNDRLEAAEIGGQVEVGDDRAHLVVTLDDERDVETASALIAQPGLLIVVDAGDNPLPAGTPLPSDVTPLVTGDDVDGAALTLDQFGNPQVKVRFTSDAAQALAEVTQAAVGHHLAFAVDGRVLMSSRLQAPLVGGEAVIAQPDWDVQSALLLAALLDSGPLPLALQVASVEIR